MSMGCAKSFVMICFDFLRCIGSALYFLDFESTFYETQRSKKHLSSSMVGTCVIRNPTLTKLSNHFILSFKRCKCICHNMKCVSVTQQNSLSPVVGTQCMWKSQVFPKKYHLFSLLGNCTFFRYDYHYLLR